MKTFLYIPLVLICITTGFSGCARRTEYPTADKTMKIATTTGDFIGFDGYENDEDIVRALYNAGFRYIDLNMYEFTPDHPYMQDDWKDKIDRLKKLADSLGMRFVQAHSQGGNPLSESAEEADFIVQATLRSIEICGALGIPNTVVHSGTKEGLTKEEWFAVNKKFYEKLLPAAEKHNVNILCENSTKANMGNKYFINTGKDMKEFINYVDNPFFHGCWDVGHANCEKNPEQNMRDLGSEMYAIHYHDNYGRKDSHSLIGCGTVNDKKILQTLKEIGFNGYFTLECDGKARNKHLYLGENPSGLGDECKGLPSIWKLQKYTRLEQEILLYNAAKELLKQNGIDAE